MMKTLFLHPPSFDGFDGGAGSRYQAQARDPLVLVPDLAGPAGGAGARQQADRRAAGAAHARRRAAARRATTTSSCCTPRRRPSPPTCKVAEALKDAQSAAQDRLRRRQGRGRAGGEPRAPRPRSISSPATSSTSRSRRSPRAAPSTTIDGLSYRNAGGAHRPQPRARGPRGHGPAALRHRGLQARSQDRGLLHRLSEAPLRLALHRARLQVALHLLPVAADGRRPSLPRAQRRPRRSRRSASPSSYFPQVKEFFFDDDTFTDDLPRAEAIARELGKLGVTWSCNAKANVPRETLEGAARQRPAAAARRLRDRQPADPAQHQEGHADRRRAPLHQGLPRARHHDPRHLHPRPARRDQGDDRGDDPLRHRDQPAHDPGLAGRALSRHLPATSRRSRTAGSTPSMPS